MARVVQRAVATRRAAPQPLGWRLLVPLVFICAGALFATSSLSSRGTDLRAGRYDDLASLVATRKAEADALQARVNDLSREVDALAAEVADGAAEKAQSRVEALEQPAGLDAVRGPAVTVTLDDAPDEIIDASSADPNDFIVHQQDIQAVVNALWAGGAEAMSIQGQRIISTTGIKCVGNTVRLQGVPYSPPYVITAIGNQQAMLSRISVDPAIRIYRQYADSPDFQLGWDLRLPASTTVPGYEGLVEMSYARVAEQVPSGADGG